MKRSKFSEEQIVYAIRQAETGTPVGDLCRQLGVSDATFYAWKKKYAHLGVSELRRLRQLEEENGRLKRLVADLSLDKHMLSEALRKKSKARTPPGTRPVVSGDVSGELPAGLSLGTVQSGRLVSPQSGEGSNRAADTHPRSCPLPSTVWIPADLGAVAARRMGGESQARSTDCSCVCGSGAGSISRCIVARPRSRLVPPSVGAWISSMIPWRMGGPSGC